MEHGLMFKKFLFYLKKTLSIFEQDGDDSNETTHSGKN